MTKPHRGEVWLKWLGRLETPEAAWAEHFSGGEPVCHWCIRGEHDNCDGEILYLDAQDGIADTSCGCYCLQ